MSFYTKNNIALKQKELRNYCLIYSIPFCSTLKKKHLA
nr:MAG TPA: hypothetical protein [Crassvirales sp.]